MTDPQIIILAVALYESNCRKKEQYARSAKDWLRDKEGLPINCYPSFLDLPLQEREAWQTRAEGLID